MASFTRSIDTALKVLLFDKFADILGIDKSGTTAQNINKGVVQIPVEIAMRELAEKRGETFLEFINFWRVGTSPSMSRQRTPAARRGLYVANTDDDKSGTIHIKAMPIDLNYNIWFWSQSLDKVYECIEKYIFWQQDNPKLNISYDTDYPLEFDLHFGEIVDESPIDEKYSGGMLFTYRFPIKIDAWVFESNTESDTVKKIILTGYDKDAVSNYSEIILEDSDQDTELADALKMFRTNLYGILDVTLVDHKVILAGNFASDFSVSDTIVWENSTSNDGLYTIVSAVNVGNNTEVVVSEDIVDDTVDGNVYKTE